MIRYNSCFTDFQNSISYCCHVYLTTWQFQKQHQGYIILASCHPPQFVLDLVPVGMDAVLRLPPLLSKALDTLCLEITVNRPDQNSLALLEIIEWRANSEISTEQFSLLYHNWLEAKGIPSLFLVKQQDTYPKFSLVTKLPESMLSLNQIIKSLEAINNEYNTLFLKQRGSSKTLEILESMFSYLDWEGVIHLRYSQVLFLFMGLSPNQALSTEAIFKSELSTLRLNLGEVQGKVSLRGFKNFISTLPESTLSNLPRNLAKIQNQLHLSDHLPDLFAESIGRWHSSSNPKLQLKEGAQKVELYRRILQEYEYLFFNTADPEKVFSDLELVYGYKQLAVFGIDLEVVRSIHREVCQSVNRYVSWFLGHSRSQPRASDKIRIQSSVRISPIKHSQSVERVKGVSSRIINRSIESIQKLSRSVDEKWSRRDSLRRVVTKSAKRAPPEYRILEDMNIFRGRRIESFETVMQRLKKRK